MTRWLLILSLFFVNLAQATPIAIIADLNGRYGSTAYHARITQAIDAIVALRPEAVVIAGDMVAGQASPPLTEPEIEAMWANFDEVIYQRLKQQNIKVLPVPGNHDASSYTAYRHERLAYEQYWKGRAPSGLSADSRFPWHYSVPLDHSRFVGLDVTVPKPLDDAQAIFLKEQRAAAQAAGQSLLVATHLPIFPVAAGREKEVIGSNQETLPGETWVSGHHHAFYAAVTPSGGIQLSVPALGGNRRAWLGTDQKSPFGFVTLDPDGVPALHGWPGFEASEPHIGPAAIGSLRRIDN